MHLKKIFLNIVRPISSTRMINFLLNHRSTKRIPPGICMVTLPSTKPILCATLATAHEEPLAVPTTLPCTDLYIASVQNLGRDIGSVGKTRITLQDSPVLRGNVPVLIRIKKTAMWFPHQPHTEQSFGHQKCALYPILSLLLNFSGLQYAVPLSISISCSKYEPVQHKHRCQCKNLGAPR